MTQTIGLRRMEMIGFRVEAACTSHKVFASVTSMRIRRNRLTIIFTTNPPCDMRKLKDDIRLSLGVPVTVFRDAVICEVAP